MWSMFCLIIIRFDTENVVVTMSANIVYQNNTDTVDQLANPAYSTINDIYNHEELPDSINMKETGNIKEGVLNLISK